MTRGIKRDLCLRVIQQYGVHADQDMTVTFSDDDLLGTARFGHMLPEAEFAWLADAHCTVCWQALGTISAWWLRHGSQTWACTVNDVPLASGEAVMLHAGDRIELGMLRLEVLDSPQAPTTSSGTVHRISEKTAPHDDMRDPGEGGTAACALAEPADSGVWGHAAENMSAWADPFDILCSSGLADSADQDRRGTLQRGDVLDELARDYAQTIVDPASLHAQRITESSVAIAAAAVNTPEQLAAQEAQQAALEDMLAGPMTIDMLLAQLGMEAAAAGRSDPDPVSPGHEEILQFFADGILPAGIRARPPALTRREHHAISLDSHYAAGGTSKNDMNGDH